jgi:hypothetical protein
MRELETRIRELLGDVEHLLALPIRFEGRISHEMVVWLTQTCSQQVLNVGKDLGVAKRVFTIVSELLDNCYRHADLGLGHLWDRQVVFIMRIERTVVEIGVSNAVLNKQIAQLAARMDELNSASAVQHRLMYMKQLRYGAISDKGGAGLGLIEVAKKSQSKLDYNFIPANQDLSIFKLCVTIPLRVEGSKLG